jgi:putrescine transport system ATP-binding protein
LNVAREPVPSEAERRAFAPWEDAAAVPLIRFAGVTKRFGATAAVDDLTLDIFERELFCLLGPSGCGKSTLLRMLAGFEEPDAGQVVLAGQNLVGVPPYRRPVNMMFQSYALFPHMTVAGNVAFGLRQERRPRAEIAARVDEILHLVQLAPFAGRYPQQLSGGQRQRVALARALVKRPKVLLLDEPLAALDKKLREETQFELKDLQARLGATFMVVTHDQQEAMTMADRIAVMNEGRIVQVAPPRELYEHPKTRFIASFVGDVNMFEGRVVSRAAGGRWRIETAASPTPLIADDSGAALQPGQAVAVAVRPEKMVVHRAPPRPTPSTCCPAWSGTSATWATARFCGSGSSRARCCAPRRRTRRASPSSRSPPRSACT